MGILGDRDYVLHTPSPPTPSCQWKDAQQVLVKQENNSTAMNRYEALCILLLEF